jgi:ceramide glucosyltransferase
MVRSMTLQHADLPMITQGAALVCFVWSVFVFLVQAIGISQL